MGYIKHVPSKQAPPFLASGCPLTCGTLQIVNISKPSVHAATVVDAKDCNVEPSDCK